MSRHLIPLLTLCLAGTCFADAPAANEVELIGAITVKSANDMALGMQAWCTSKQPKASGDIAGAVSSWQEANKPLLDQSSATLAGASAEKLKSLSTQYQQVQTDLLAKLEVATPEQQSDFCLGLPTRIWSMDLEDARARAMDYYTNYQSQGADKAEAKPAP